jgi:anti-sigma factor RsiW
MSRPAGPGGIGCREVVEVVTDYLEGALPPDVHARLAAHLQVCGGCAVYVEQMRATAWLASVARLEQPPDAAALRAALRVFKAR